MANIRDLKKDINYVLGDIIEAVYLDSVYNNLTPKIKDSKYGKDLESLIVSRKKLEN